MAKELYVRGYGTPRRGRLPGKKTVFFWLLAVIVLVGGLLWRRLERPPPHRSVPLATKKVVGQVPPPPEPADASDAQHGQAPPAPERSTSAELRFAMEAEVKAPVQPADKEQRQEADKERTQVSELAEKRSDQTRGVGIPRLEHEPREQGAQGIERRGSRDILDRAVVIQVGAFRRSASAEELKRRLQKQGYDAYLDARVLEKLGLLHRVRIRGCTTVAEARAVMERLQREEGLQAFALDLDTGATVLPEQ
jgi:cell division septation protein DedD